MADAILKIPRAGTQPVSGMWLRAWRMDLLLSLVLLGVAWAIARDYVHGDLFIWGDHPGQFMRFWYPLAHSVPQSGLVVDWNPNWYAGYPELQFYPPGTVLLGVALDFLTLGLLPPERIYNLLPAIAFVLPLFTCFVFLRMALAPLGRLPSRLAGLTAGLLAVVFTPMWGGIDAVVIGMVGERLAFGLAPLGLWAGWRLVQRPGGGRLAVASGLLAALVLLHPFHAPAPVAAVVAYAAVRSLLNRGRLSPRPKVLLLWLGLYLVLAIGLVAWWLLPVLLRYSPYAAALIRANPDQVLSWLDAGRVPRLWLAALPAILLLTHRHPRIRSTIAVLLAFPPLLAAAILLDDRLLVEGLGISALDPVRFIGQYYLALLLLAGCAAGAVATRALWRVPPLGIAALATLVVALAPWTPDAWRDLRDHAYVPPQSRQAGLLEHPAFAEFWEALRKDPTPGRVLFTSHYLQVPWPDGTTTPTTLTSMTPYLAGREIVGGTFSHWSPVARWLWVGDPWARVLPAQVELEDNRRLFGIGWEEMDDGDLAAKLRMLNVTTVVAGPSDDRARARLESSPHFRRVWENGFFTLYHTVGAPGEWIEAEGAVARVVERSPRSWVIAVQSAEPDAKLTLKMSYYPLWRATIEGQPVQLTANAVGLQEMALPEGAPYRLEVAYRAGWLEWAGLLASLVSLAGLGMLVGMRPPRARKG